MLSRAVTAQNTVAARTRFYRAIASAPLSAGRASTAIFFPRGVLATRGTGSRLVDVKRSSAAAAAVSISSIRAGSCFVTASRNHRRALSSTTTQTPNSLHSGPRLKAASRRLLASASTAMKQSSIASFFNKKPAGSTASPVASPAASTLATTPDNGSPPAKKVRRMVVSSDDEEEDAVNVQQAVTVKQDATAAPLGHAVKENTVDAGNTPVTEAENEASSIDADMPVEDNSTATVDAETSASSTAGKAKASPSKGTRSSPSKANFDAKAAPETDEETETAKQSLALFSSKEAAVLDDIEWQAGTPTPFSALAKTFEAIEGTTKRLIILDMLTKFFVKVIQLSPDDLLTCIHLCINRLGPTWEGVELGIGETILIKAIASATGRAVPKIKADLAVHGDLGKVAQASRSTQQIMFQPKPLTVQSVFKTLKEIAAFSGHSSMQRKIEKIKFLLVAARDNEARYLIRSLEGKLRIGLAEQTVIVALAHASVYSKHKSKASGKKAQEDLTEELAEAAAVLKQVYSELPTYAPIIPPLLQKDIQELPAVCKLTPGIPLKPMLAHPTKSISEVLDRFENMPFTCEFKYDGERAQIHKLAIDPTTGKPPKEDLCIFSRNQENMSSKYPDIMETMRVAPKEGVSSFVLDTEAVAWDAKEGHILPFQVLSTRKRKDVTAEDIKVQVCVFAFDILYLNGEPLVRKTLEERRQLLRDSFHELPGKFTFAKAFDGRSVEDIQHFLDDSIEGNCEGLMVKTLRDESSYEPSKRSRNWLKVKKDYLEGVGDSLDLVVIGGYVGKGKRTGGYGGFLLACYDEESEQYQAVCKIGTGFSDEDLATHSAFFKQHEMVAPKPYYAIRDAIKPDFWFDAAQVWEVKTADLSISPVYTAGIGKVDPEKGISLRFPRFIRIRDDKQPDQATTSTQIAEMYQAQKINGAAAGAAGAAGAGADDDFEY